MRLCSERAGVVATMIEAAFASATRRRGLLGREALAPGAALILAPCSAIHTFFMRFPIDVVFTARDGAVTRVCRQVAPWRIRAAFGAFAAVELPAGGAHAVDRGDRLRLEDFLS